LTVQDDDGGTSSADVIITVNNVVPTLALVPGSTVEVGQTARVTGVFNDVGSDTLQGVINYGDGASEALVLQADKSFSANHVFTNAGTFTATVTITDDDGGSVSRQVAFTVNPATAVPQPALAPLNGGFIERSTVNLVILRFNVDVGTSLTASDIILRNLSTGATITPDRFILTYSSSGNTATILFPNLPNQRLPDGVYRLRIGASSVLSNSKPLAQDFIADFHVLAGDANGDLATNDLDLFRVWQNQLKAPANRDLNDDLNQDGQITSADLDIVRNNYGNRLAPIGAVGSNTGGTGTLSSFRTELFVPSFQAPSAPGSWSSDLNSADDRLRGLERIESAAPVTLTSPLNSDSFVGTQL